MITNLTLRKTTWRPVQDVKDVLHGGHAGVQGGHDVSEGQLEFALLPEELVHGGLEQLQSILISVLAVLQENCQTNLASL